MINVDIICEDAVELDIIRQAVTIIEQYRAQKANGTVATAPPPPAPPAAKKAEAPAPLQVASEEQAVAALRQLIDTKGLPVARALVEAYSVTRVSEMTPQQRADFIGKAQQEIAS